MMPPAPPHADDIGALYVQHARWLQDWLRRRLGNAPDAADLAHDTFVRILRQRLSGDLREPRAYLASIARSVLVDHMRRRTIEQAYRDVLAAQPQSSIPSLEVQAMVMEALVEIDRLLDGMGDRVKQTFLLVQCEGLTYAETAQRLGISVRTVSTYVARAMLHCCEALP